MIELTQIISQVEGIIVSDMDGEKVMLSIDSGKYYNLGEMGGDIWERIKEPLTTEELIGQLTTHYDVDKQECEQQVISFLSQLVEEGLIQVDQPVKR